MAASPTSRVIEHLRRVVLLQAGAGLRDDQLLEEFLNQRDNAAFEALVRRHGPMVLGICQRILRNGHDVEDAFQATFLVLVRKAASISKRELLANWLFGVAHRTALHVRKKAAKQRAKEGRIEDMAKNEAIQDDATREMLSLLDQELSRLPEKYRVPIILCDLEGKSRKKAAKQLDLPIGTLSTRLDRARGMLAKRLARHGIKEVGAAAVLTAAGAVPSTLVASTVNVAALDVTGQLAAAGAISAKVAALTEGVVRMMLLTKLKNAITAFVLMAVFGGGIGELSRLAFAENQIETKKESEKKADGPKQNPAEPPEGKRSSKAEKKDEDKIQGTWEVVEFTANGGLIPHELSSKIKFVLKDNKMEISGTDGTDKREYDVKLDSTKKPKEFDAMMLFDPFKGTTCPAIYELDGDKLKLCMPNGPNVERPTEFTAPVGSKHGLFVLKRAKP